MTKASGLGANFYIDGYNLSGDIGSLSRIGGGVVGTQDVTGIDKSAFERLGLLRDGSMEFTAYFNVAASQAHPVLSTLPTTDRNISYIHGTTLGNPMASMVAKQINYDPTRNQDGSLTLGISALANGYGLEWGQSLTAGIRTDTTDTNGTSIDQAAATTFGGQAWLHVTALTGNDVTIAIEDSANNTDFVAVSNFAFTQVTAAPASERLAKADGTTLRRYVRVVTTGDFSSVSFAVQVTKNLSSIAF